MVEQHTWAKVTIIMLIRRQRWQRGLQAKLVWNIEHVFKCYVTTAFN